MNVDVKGVHYDISSNTRDRIDKRLARLKYAENLIIDLLVTITREKRGYKIEATTNFRWGTSSHISVKSYTLFHGIDSLFKKLNGKIRKEKEKKQEH